MALITVDARLLHASGIGTYLQNLLPRLVAIMPRARFHLLTDGDAPGAAEWPVGAERGGVRAPIYSVREQLEIPARTPPETDLFWSPHYNVPLLRRGPLVVTVHDLLHLARPEFVGGWHRGAYARGMFAATRRASARIFDSRFTADEYRRLVGDGRGASTVIHPGVDPSWFSLPAGESPRPRPYFLYVGNVKPHKNLRGLLAAYGSLAAEIPHDLVVVGRREGFIHGDVRVQAEASRLGERVHFTGWVEEALVKQYFAHAEALVFPSFYEGFGLPPLEAMACGCPTIVSEAASLPEVCGDAALYVDPARPETIAGRMREIVRDPALRAELAERGRARAAGFGWDRCAAATAQVLDAALPG